MVAWVQLPAFPVHFYHQEILFSLENMIGRAIKLDFHTQHQKHVKFARMAVELDLSKPLISRIRLDGKWQYIEYENLPKVCFECGKVGHTTATCPSLCESAVSIGIGTAAGSPEKCSEESPEEKAGFGSWMQVTRRSRRGTRGHEKGNSDGNQGDLVVGGNTEKGKGNHKNIESSSGSKGGFRENQGQRTGNLQQVKGPNDTSIQIVAVPPYETQQAAERVKDSPSAAVRTKNQNGQKKKKSKSPRKTSVPITTKALQVWTPVKEKKNKTRARLTSLTLQEIEAWTGAAQAAAAETSSSQALEVEHNEKMIPTLETAGSA
ncbi:unnamed protein product [Linum trigynum]|uniref:CCHC-type domain-containing protein n=1 Tax=Linum trigynum TaxID=586398 RepID=A0AAV2F5A8_9ROSI